jgi:hypothetical protein
MKPTARELDLAFRVAWRVKRDGGIIEADPEVAIQAHRLVSLLQFQKALEQARISFDQDKEDGYQQALFAVIAFLNI